MKIPMTKQNYEDVTYIICVDLSNPGQLVQSTDFWLEAIRTHSEARLNEIFDNDNTLFNLFTFKKIEEFQEHEDSKRVRPLPVNTVIIGTKYDKYDKLNPETRKWISRTLRYLSHYSGASLLFSSNQNVKLASSLRRDFHNLIFSGSIQEAQLDPMYPLVVQATQDQLAQMGLPPAQGHANLTREFQKILKNYQDAKGAKEEVQKVSLVSKISNFPEPKIDEIKAEKDKAMEIQLKSNLKEEKKVQSSKVEEKPLNFNQREEKQARFQRQKFNY